jgi:hypothetical protein
VKEILLNSFGLTVTSWKIVLPGTLRFLCIEESFIHKKGKQKYSEKHPLQNKRQTEQLIMNTSLCKAHLLDSNPSLVQFNCQVLNAIFNLKLLSREIFFLARLICPPSFLLHLRIWAEIHPWFNDSFSFEKCQSKT